MSKSKNSSHKDNSKYFNDVKNKCIAECKSSTLEATANGMFSRKEVVDLFKKMESSDDAFSILIDEIRQYFCNSNNINLFIPGGGSGGLSRRILKDYPRSSILNLDSSLEMVNACKHNPIKYKNIETVCGDISTFNCAKKFDAIVAYGVMRYIPENSRNSLVDSWHDILKDDGIVIVGEGVAKNIIDNIVSTKYNNIDYVEKDARLFRCSLFYHLFKKYSEDNAFSQAVNRTVESESTFSDDNDADVTSIDILCRLAGYSDSSVYLKIFEK
jgi:hypothetical protein